MDVCAAPGHGMVCNNACVPFLTVLPLPGLAELLGGEVPEPKRGDGDSGHGEHGVRAGGGPAGLREVPAPDGGEDAAAQQQDAPPGDAAGGRGDPLQRHCELHGCVMLVLVLAGGGGSLLQEVTHVLLAIY